MAEKFRPLEINYDLQQNKLANLVIQNLPTASAPQEPKVGYIYYDTTVGAYAYCTAAAVKTGDEITTAATWRFAASKKDLQDGLAALRASFNFTATDNVFGLTASISDGTANTKTVYLDGLVLGATVVEQDDSETPVKGHFLRLTTTDHSETGGTSYQYVAIPETIVSGALDQSTAGSEKLVFTLSDSTQTTPSTIEVDLTALYQTITAKSITVTDTDTIDFTSTAGTSSSPQEISAAVKLSDASDQAITVDTTSTNHGLLVKKATSINATPSSATNAALATEKAVSTAVDDAKTALTLSGTGPITVTYGSTKTVSIAAATTSAAGVVELADSSDAITGTNTTKAVTPKALHDAIVQNIKGGVTYIGDLAQASDLELPVQKGDLFLITADFTLASVALHANDYILFKNTVATGGTVAASDFNVIDNTEDTDLVYKDKEQTLTRKTLDLATSGTGAGQNVITNAQVGIFASDVVVDETTGIAAAGSASDTKIATEAAIRAAVDAASADAAAAVHIEYILTAGTAAQDNANNFWWADNDHDSANWTITTPWTNHKKLKAQLLKKMGTSGSYYYAECDSFISYNETTGSVTFGINCSALPAAGDYKAIIMG